MVRATPDARLEELALQSPNGTIDTDSLRQIRLDEQVKDPVMSILTGDLLHMLLVSAAWRMIGTIPLWAELSQSRVVRVA